MGDGTWTGVCVETYDFGKVATIQGLQCLLANALSVVFTVIGLAGFIMLLVGAFRYMIAGSDSKGVDNARNTITLAIVGLVVALSAYMIVRIISQFTGVPTLLEFKIPSPNDTSI